MKYAILTTYNIQEMSGGGHSLRKIVKAIELIDSDAQICIFQRSLTMNDEDMYWNFRSIKMQRNYLKSTLRNVISRILLYPNFMNLYKKRIALDISSFEPDFIFFIGTRLGELFHEITNHYPKAIQRAYVQVENFEIGMIDNTRNTLQKLFSNIERRSIIRSEREMIKSNKLIFLSNEDKKNFEEFYHNVISKSPDYRSWVVPHCYYQDLSPQDIEHSIKERYNKLQREKEVQILFTGSFYLQSNVQAVYNILKASDSITAVFKAMGFGVKYIVAGYNAKIFASVGDRLTIMNRPTQSELQSVFRSSDIYISPVTMGTGVNTKIAEALSYGLPIVVERYSLRGYDELLNSCHDFVFDINRFSEKDAHDLISNYISTRLRAYDFFSDNYSINVFAKSIRRIIDEVQMLK